jgi:adenylate kinase family enzyme
MNIRLPSRYEDLNEEYRGRLVPNPSLLSLVDSGFKSMKISGGIRFLPLYGDSGSGKSCAAREIDSHMPQTRVFVLNRDEIEHSDKLIDRINMERRNIEKGELLIAVIDQFEEIVSSKADIPTQFVEQISILDRNILREIPVLFVWLTTSREFQMALSDATVRNNRILLASGFIVHGPDREKWPRIIKETFSFHNDDKPLADYMIIDQDLQEIAKKVDTIGAALQAVAEQLSSELTNLQNLSEYRVSLVWPVSDALRNQRVLQFCRPRDGYTLNWEAWQTELNEEDRKQLPLGEFNRARLYFDVRVIPVRVADLHKLCKDLDDINPRFGKTYLERFRNTHLHHIISGTWSEYDFNPVRERESKRAEEARNWYLTVTNEPTKLGRRLASIFNELGLIARYEEVITSKYGSIRADVFIEQFDKIKKKQILEMKVFAPENTMPSTIKDAIKVTLRRHAQFAGFLQRM